MLFDKDHPHMRQRLLSAKSSPIVDSVVCVLTLLVAFALIEEVIDDTAEDEECKMTKKQTTR